jgi:hypothetical protein
VVVYPVTLIDYAHYHESVAWAYVNNELPAVGDDIVIHGTFVTTGETTRYTTRARVTSVDAEGASPINAVPLPD